MQRINIHQIAKDNIALFINEDIALIDDLEALQSISLLDSGLLIDGYALIMVLCGSIYIKMDKETRKIGPGNIIICPPNNLLKNVMVSIDFRFKSFFSSTENGNIIAREKGSSVASYTIFQDGFGIIPVSEETMTMCVKTFELFKLCLTNKSLPNKSKITDSLYLTLVRILEETMLNNKQVENSKPFKSAETIMTRFFHIIEHSKIKRQSVGKYAELLHISPKYFSNVCKQITGKSANAVINEYVIKDAILMLHDKRKTVKEIALELGFINQSHFGSFFRGIKGISPNNFRTLL